VNDSDSEHSANVARDEHEANAGNAGVHGSEATGSFNSDHGDLSGDEFESGISYDTVPTQLDTDKGNCSHGALTSEKKMHIVRNGPCQPNGPFPTNVASKRCFSEHYYAQESKCRITIKHEWLCYSPKLNKAIIYQHGVGQ